MNEKRDPSRMMAAARDAMARRPAPSAPSRLLEELAEELVADTKTGQYVVQSVTIQARVLEGWSRRIREIAKSLEGEKP